MFCTNCGESLQEGSRFCSACGHAVGNSAAASLSSPPVYSYQPALSPPLSPNSMLINPAGYPQPAFNILAAALFHGLDANVRPQRTSGLEVSKMTAYRTMGGLTVAPYYGEYVLPTYASVVGVDLVPGQPRNAPVVSWSGWHQFLMQKIMAEPEATFRHLLRVCPALGIPINFSRADFPASSFPAAEIKEASFRTQIGMMAQRALGGGMGAGAVGLGANQMFGGGFSGGSAGSSGSGKLLAAKVGLEIGSNLLNASTGGTGGLFFPPTYPGT